MLLDHTYFIDSESYIYDAVIPNRVGYLFTLARNIDLIEDDTRINVWDYLENNLLVWEDFNYLIKSIIFDPNSDATNTRFLIISVNSASVWKFFAGKNKLKEVQTLIKDSGELMITDACYIKLGKSQIIHDPNKDEVNKEDVYDYGIAIAYTTHKIALFDKDYVLIRVVNTLDCFEGFDYPPNTLKYQQRYSYKDSKRIKYIILRDKQIFVFFKGDSEFYLVFDFDYEEIDLKLTQIEHLETEDENKENKYNIKNKIYTDSISVIINETKDSFLFAKAENLTIVRNDQHHEGSTMNSLVGKMIGMRKKDKQYLRSSTADIFSRNEMKRKEIHELQNFSSTKAKYFIYSINFQRDLFEPPKEILKNSSMGKAVEQMCISENPRVLLVQHEKGPFSIYLHKDVETDLFRDLENNKDEGILVNFVKNTNFDFQPVSITIHPYGTMFFVAFFSFAQFYSILNNEIKEMGKLNAQFKAAAFSSTGSYIAMGCTEEVHRSINISILNSDTLELEYVITQLPTFPLKIEWLDHDSKILVLLEDNCIFVWTLDNHNFVIVQDRIYHEKVDYKILGIPRGENLYLRHTESTEKITDIAYDWVVDHLIIATDDKKIKIYNKRGEDKYLEFYADCKYKCIALGRKLDIILFGTSEGTIRGCLWPISNFSKIEQIDHPFYTEKCVSTGRISSLKISTDLQYVYTGSEDGSVIISLLKVFMNERILQKKNLFYFNEKNLLKKKSYINYGSFNYLTDLIYKGIVETISAKEVDITGELNDNVTKIDKRMLEYSSEIENLRNDMNAVIEKERTSVKDIEGEKELESKKLREEREKQTENNHSEISNQKIQYKKLKEEKQKQTKTLTGIIKDAKANFEINLKNLDDLRNQGNENIHTIFDNMDQALREKLRAIESLTREKEKVFNKELNNLEVNYEKKINKDEEVLNLEKKELDSKKKEIVDNIQKINKNNESYQEKIEQWEKNLEELKINNSDLMESFLFNTLKLKQMNNLLGDNEKQISNQEKIVKEKRSVNDKLEQLRYVLEYQITNLVKEKTPIEEQIKNFEELHNDFYQRFNLLYAEQLNIEDCIENNSSLIKKFKNELSQKKSSLYAMKNRFKAIDLVNNIINILNII